MNKEVSDALHMLLHCSLKDTEYETQINQFNIVYKYINKLEQENKQLKEQLKEITKRIRKAIDDDEDDLLYVLFDIQDIIQDEEEQKRAFDKYIKPYIGDKENENNKQ